MIDRRQLRVLLFVILLMYAIGIVGFIMYVHFVRDGVWLEN